MVLLSRRTGLGVAVAALVSLANPAQAADLPCFEESAMQSARIHDLRVMLMVNALKCRARHPQTLRSYGDLLSDRGEELDDHSRKVLSALVDQYGPAQGTVAYNRYETKIANYHSLTEPSLRQCHDVAAYINLAQSADHAELQTLSRLVTNRSIDICLVPVGGAGSDALADSDALAPPAAMTSAAAEGPEIEIVDGIPTYNVPGTGPDTQPEPLEQVALPAAGTTDPQPAPAQERQASAADEKLDQAIAALGQAVAALSDLRREP